MVFTVLMSYWFQFAKFGTYLIVFMYVFFMLKRNDLPQILVPHVKLGFSPFLFLNSGTPLALEDGNSKNVCLKSSLLLPN